MIQTSKQDKWIDAAGVEVPYSRTTRMERQKESSAARLLKAAQQISGKLTEFKQQIEKDSQSFFEEVLREHNADRKKPRKGNYTWYNFDKSIRVEVSASERVEFKQPEIGLAKEKLEEFISEGLGSSEEFIRQLVNDAFQNTKGQLDPKKVLSLLKYRNRTKAKKFHDALDLIEASIDRNASKTYYRIATRNESTGEYEYVKLNFSEV